MVDPVSSITTAPATSAIHQNSGLITASSEDAGNDEPPPIPLPPVGHQQPTGGVQSPASHARRSDVSGFKEQSARTNVRVHDYGNPSSSRDDAATFTTPDDENAPTLTGTPSAGSSQSSLTAVSVDNGDAVVEFADAADPHTRESKEIAQALDVNLEHGLSSDVAAERLKEDGPNKLTTGGGIKWYTVLGRQVSNSLTLVRDPCICRVGLFLAERTTDSWIVFCSPFRAVVLCWLMEEMLMEMINYVAVLLCFFPESGQNPNS